jgi:hypothetical protein
MLRTAELLAGINPLSLNDALATPMYNAFISGNAKPDNTPYNVIAPNYDIATANVASAADALMSDQLPWNHIDWVPQELQDQILWAAIHGASSPAPPPGPNASAEEHQRAVAVRATLRRSMSLQVLPSTGGLGLRALPPSDG